MFAVPGRSTDAQSKGTNRLIRNGAFPLEWGKQIIEQIQPCLFNTHQPQHIDEIVSTSGVHLTKTLTLLLGMELKGAVIQLSGKQFVRA